MILNLDTSNANSVEVSLKKNGQEFKKMSEHNQFGSQVLLPLISKILGQNNLKFKDLTAIEVATGPGSFTGLRVGATVAQALGFVLGIPVNNQNNGSIKLKYEN